jgi:hypothetical protein
MRRFELDDGQMKKANDFIVQCHTDDPDRNYGAIGGAFTYTFTPTSVGVVCKLFYLKDTEHEKVVDLSDYGSW